LSDKSSRSEKPTQKKLDKAREQGRFAISRHVLPAVQFLVALKVMERYFLQDGAQFAGAWRLPLRLAGSAANQPAEDLLALIHNSVQLFTPMLYTAAFAILALSIAAQLVMTSGQLAPQKLAPDFGRLNTLPRLGGMFGSNWTQFVRAALLFPLLAGLAFWILKEPYERVRMAVSVPLRSVMASSFEMVLFVLKLSAIAVCLYGAWDWLREWKKHGEELAMTKQEVKDEHKESEGNPEVKGRMRRLMRQMSKNRMMSDVPKATMVIVNPTHFAVALQYDHEEMAVPKVVAKGIDHMALRIRETARQNQVPIIENPPLAQSLYKSVEIGQEIPAHLYRAVAEVLAYVYRVAGRRA
jgi:flagellar biosynthesis protein FlhB